MQFWFCQTFPGYSSSALTDVIAMVVSWRWFYSQPGRRRFFSSVLVSFRFPAKQRDCGFKRWWLFRPITNFVTCDGFVVFVMVLQASHVDGLQSSDCWWCWGRPAWAESFVFILRDVIPTMVLQPWGCRGRTGRYPNWWVFPAWFRADPAWFYPDTWMVLQACDCYRHGRVLSTPRIWWGFSPDPV